MEQQPAHQPIQQLAPDEVQKICAGEVVERPLSVVKELIENALDAGATQVTVELEDGGKQLIRVSDNGRGIPVAELPLAVKSHCTSKIRGLNDLFALTTLGFRGEALASVAAVARLSLASRHASDDLGGRIEVSGGALIRQERCALQQGTEVEVRELFFNTPARLKFLKSTQSEGAQVSGLLCAYALAYPEVRWRLLSGGRQTLSADGDGDLRAVLLSLLGAELAEGLAAIDFEFPPSAVHGFVSDPRHHRPNRSRQWYFVNRRPVSNKLLFKAVDDAVREFMSPGKFPAGAFFLDLPPEEVDVNVHPMKSEVNFAQAQGVYSLLVTAVRRALGGAAQRRQYQLTRGLSGVIQPVAPAPGGTPAAPSAPSARPPGLPLGDDAAASFDQPELDEQPAPGRRAVPVYRSDQPFLAPAVQAAPPEPAGVPPASSADEIRLPPAAATAPVAQVANTYLAVATPEAVYLIDQHAAHERILFEQLYRALESPSAPPRQALLFPLVLQLTPGEAGAYQEYLPALRALGFTVELGAADNLIVKEVPQLLAGRVTAELIHAALTELAAMGRAGAVAEQYKDLCATLACKAAIKAGQVLNPEQRTTLLTSLVMGDSSLSCPHGRPTVLRLSADELERMFRRS